MKLILAPLPPVAPKSSATLASPSPCFPPPSTKRHTRRIRPRPRPAPCFCQGRSHRRRAAGPAIVIGADTEVTLENHIFGKPRSSDDARHMLEKLSGRTHAVVTGVALIRIPDAERLTFVESTLVHFATLSAEEISRYLSTGEPHDKAGAYGIQGRAGATFRASKAAISTSSACPSPASSKPSPPSAGPKTNSPNL